jgi:hypothetical protein
MNIYKLKIICPYLELFIDFLSSHIYSYISYLLWQIISEFWHYFQTSCPLGLYVKYLYQMWICAERVSMLVVTNFQCNKRTFTWYWQLTVSTEQYILYIHIFIKPFLYHFTVLYMIGCQRWMKGFDDDGYSRNESSH